MTPRYPGATWRGPGGNGDGACSHRSCSWHEVVSTSNSVYAWNAGARACHLYNGQQGQAEQYADFDERVSGTYQGNPDVLTVENWDGLLPSTGRSPDGSFGPNDRPFTDEQVERAIDEAAWMSLPAPIGLGIPLRWMNTTREAGHAPHRLGVPRATGKVQIPYGPDQWTTHPGKECPGDQRVVQLRDVIIPGARVLAPLLAAGKVQTLPPGPVDVAFARARYRGVDRDWWAGWFPSAS